MRAEARARAVAGVLVVVLAALVAATFDGADWPDQVPLPQRAEQPGDEPAQGTPGDAEDTAGDGEASDPEPDVVALPAWVATVVRAVVLLLLVAAIAAILTSLRFAFVRRRLRGDAALRGDAVPLPTQEPEPDTAEVETALADSLAGLDEGSPRNAVVACWVRLEELATRQGLERHESDTPAEFVTRALEAYALDRAALETLADLYREARFSRHALEERHRTTARRCLEKLAEDVRRPAVLP